MTKLKLHAAPEPEGFMNLNPKVVQLLKDVKEYTKRERADEPVSNDEMVVLWLRICKNAKSKPVRDLLKFLDS